MNRLGRGRVEIPLLSRGKSTTYRVCGVCRMEITKTLNRKVTVLHVSGRVDTSAVPGLDLAIKDALAAGARRVLLDLREVVYISSGGLRILLSTAKKLASGDDRFGLYGLQTEVYKIFKLAGFTSIFSLFASEEDALAAWG
jgi:anti-sigma B factor antagonist